MARGQNIISQTISCQRSRCQNPVFFFGNQVVILIKTKALKVCLDGGPKQEWATHKDG